MHQLLLVRLSGLTVYYRRDSESQIPHYYVGTRNSRLHGYAHLAAIDQSHASCCSVSPIAPLHYDPILFGLLYYTWPLLRL